MKVNRIVLVLLILTSLSCNAKKSEIIIIGKIIGDIPEKVEYTTPINATWFYGSKQSVKPDSLGNFKITININSPSFITLYIPNKASGTLLIEPKKFYNINFNLTLKDKKFIVTGKRNKAQNIYNSFPNPDFNIFDLNKFLKDSVTSVIASKIKTNKEREILMFQELFDEKEISEDFFALIKLDRECYYAAIQGKVAFIKFMDSYRNNNEELKNSSLDLWNTVFNTMPIITPMLNSSPWFYSLAENYVNYKEYTNPTFNLDELTEIYKQGLIHAHQISESNKYLKDTRLEYFNASYLYYHCWQNKDNSKELITQYYNFKEDYPSSNYIKHLTYIVTPIIEFHKKVEEASSSNKIKFIDNYKNIDSFDELTKTLRGKKIYIDIWGTWCGPCKKEFEHKDDLKKLLNSKKAEVLYICEGRSSKEKVWKEMIKGYNLEGYHIMANEKLLADIIKIFGNNDSIYYPHYILIDEDGIVINKSAPKPSELIKLERQLNSFKIN